MHNFLREAHNLRLAGIHCKYIVGFTDYLESECSVEALSKKGLKDKFPFFSLVSSVSSYLKIHTPIPGTDGSHKIIGEVRENGCLYTHNAFVYHEKSQHPTMYIGNNWKRVIVGRISGRGMISAD